MSAHQTRGKRVTPQSIEYQARRAIEDEGKRIDERIEKVEREVVEIKAVERDKPAR